MKRLSMHEKRRWLFRASNDRRWGLATLACYEVPTTIMKLEFSGTDTDESQSKLINQFRVIRNASPLLWRVHV